jgi:hypothetical protein
MGDYFNSTRGPLAATLNDGASLSIPPKRWIYIDPVQEGSASIEKLVSKGFLVRSKVPITVVPAPVSDPVVAVKVEAAEAKAAEPTPPALKVEEPKIAASTSPEKEEISKKKR